jgi:hypothetical protein
LNAGKGICYVNALIQGLFHSNVFIRWLSSANGPRNEMVEALLSLHHKLLNMNSIEDNISASEVIDLVNRDREEKFIGYGDPTEFLIAMFDMMFEGVSKEWVSFEIRTYINEVIRGTVNEQILVLRPNEGSIEMVLEEYQMAEEVELVNWKKVSILCDQWWCMTQ